MSIRVLIVDNKIDPAKMESHADTLCHALTKMGCEAKSFSSGREALEDYLSYMPHLIICDEIFSDGVHAWDLAFSILNPNPKTRPYFVALLTYAGRRNRALCEEFGFDEIAAKPIVPDDLRRWVKKAQDRAEGVEAK